ncbi:ATP-binding protein [uncultured Brevundimonas sp.]|uniref:ATP-binding protein n=1 Tax=uncultured Brevundimonas sp. TaxID=213418 RepID=UPI0025F1C8A8|nr:ATP-binding protein [uncultured Brevundimonas sp.]
MPDRPSLRGAGFGSLLADQHAYAQQSRSRSKFGLMVPEAFVRGIRDLGYRSNGDAVAELVDNAIQAYADRVDVLFGYDRAASSKKPVQLAVVDNGHGMEPDMIRMAVMWGGTHRENDRNGLGRYGYGLPCSSVSLGRRFTVLSKVGDGGLYAVQLDLDAITAGQYTDAHGDIIVPKPEPAVLPDFVAAHIQHACPDGWTSGTVILIDKLDRLEWTTAQGLRENLCRQFGVTYHKLRGHAAIYVDGDYVEPIDPLFLTEDFHLHDLDEDRAHAFDPVRIEVRDPETNAYRGAVLLRYAWLPPSFGSVDKARDAVGLNANARFSILKDYHGVIFSRNGRLIDVQTRTPWTVFINNDRYIKVEVEFAASLDELFGVTTSKQQVTVSPVIWDHLREAGLPKAIEQLRNKVKEAKAVRRAEALEPPLGQQRLSEQAMRFASALGTLQSEDTAWDERRRVAPYRIAVEHRPGQPFFRMDRHNGARTLNLNSAHRFYDAVYDGPTATPETRTGLELLLFALGDVMMDEGREQEGRNSRQVSIWSRRLEAALVNLEARLHHDHDDEFDDDFDVDTDDEAV